jgi:hypothetical protein
MAVGRVGDAAPCRSCGPEIRTRGCRGAGHAAERRRTMPTVTMVYGKGERCWLGKRLQDPEVMTQGETLEELEDNLRDA